MIDGKLYFFGGRGPHDDFMLDVSKDMALANRCWSEEINVNNVLLTRTLRLVFHVPHWKTGEELADEVA